MHSSMMASVTSGGCVGAVTRLSTRAPAVAVYEAELSDAIASARKMLDHAEKLLPDLGHFSG